MSQDSRSYEEKKRTSIVHKPFLKGTINLFNPPKKNPNGSSATSRASKKDLSSELSSQMAKADEIVDYQPAKNSETKDYASSGATQPKLEKFSALSVLNGWRVSAILLVLSTNVLAAVAITNHQKSQVAVVETAPTEKYRSGKTDLTHSEFDELALQDLKNIAPAEVELAVSGEKIPNSPLAIPPSSLPDNIVLPQLKAKTDYYYILAQYTGDRSLEIAKAKVPSVSLVNFPQGLFLYLGAFTEKNAAHDFIKELQQSGLEGYVYPFD